jgi:hypothetical protein
MKSFVTLLAISACLALAIGDSLPSYMKDLTITKAQLRKLNRFKARVLPKLPHEYMKQDLFLVRWLRVKDFDVDSAEEALMSSLKWRAQNKMDTVLQEDWSGFKSRFPYLIHGEDKEGKPLIFFNVGIMDLRSVTISGETNKFNRYIDSAIEEACRKVRNLQETTTNVTQGVLIIDIAGYNLHEHGCPQCIPLILRAISTYENHYPGCAEKILLLNTPQIFEPLLTAGRALLSAYTNNVLYVFGSNQREWKAFLGKYFEWNQLPSTIGGTVPFPPEDDDSDSHKIFLA